LQRLHAAHRGAHNRSKPFNAERTEQALLARDHVAYGKPRKQQIRLRSAVARRRCQSVADRIDADDEVAVGIERTARSDQEIQPVMGRADRGQDQDDVVVGRRAPAMRDITEREIADHLAAFERQVTHIKRLMCRIDPAGLQRRMPPA
jgi:hypothetical protein